MNGVVNFSVSEVGWGLRSEGCREPWWDYFENGLVRRLLCDWCYSLNEATMCMDNH